MRSILQRPFAAAMGAIALGSAGIGLARAADVPAPQARIQPPPPNYYGGPPVEESYVYPPPIAYGYPPPPPPSYYEYAPPPVVIRPSPYYWGRHYGPIYGDRAYGPYVARGYGRYERPWGRGYRGW